MVECFKINTEEQLHEDQVLDLLSPHMEVAILIFEVYLLDERYTHIIPTIIPAILRPLPTPPTLIFNFFADENEPQTIREIRSRKKWEPTKQSGSLDKFEWEMKRKAMEYII